MVASLSVNELKPNPNLTELSARSDERRKGLVHGDTSLPKYGLTNRHWHILHFDPQEFTVSGLRTTTPETIWLSPAHDPLPRW